MESKIRRSLLHSAHAIVCTLSSKPSNGPMKAAFGKHLIRTCIVDEATQCVEAETLIPLLLCVKTLFLVGDPNQLPATVVSLDAKKYGLDRSLFSRTKAALDEQTQDLGKENPVFTLKEQHRMHPQISLWPNNYFYNGDLIDVVKDNESWPFHAYRILNIDVEQDSTKFFNENEAKFIRSLINALMIGSEHVDAREILLAIVTPYQAQRKLSGIVNEQ